jgi:formiminotetrahydrofolate cyclodeaminase
VARGHNAAKRGIAVSLEAFLGAVAERTPAPGGGAAAAAACALGAALAEMAARFAAREDDAALAARLRAEALRLGEADLDAYAPVLEALRAGDAARVAAAKGAAAETPLAIAEAAAAVAELARALANEGKPSLVGDALAGADIAAAAARAAARLVEINLADATGDPRVARARAAVARAAPGGEPSSGLG